jgi:hypothetical protein
MKNRVPGGISPSTVRRVLKEEGLKYLVREEREDISPEQAENRLKFATSRLNYDWRYALFCDEKTFQLGAHKKKSWQDPDDRKAEKIKRHPPTIHVWGGIGLHFKSKLYFFNQNLNAALYCKIISKRLPPYYTFELKPHERNKWILVQDNDPKHTSKRATKVLDELAPDRIRDWPSNSPDWNIIEDVWSMLESELERKRPTTIPKMKRVLSKAWADLDMTKVRSSVQSLPARLEEGIKLKGERTSY